MFCKVCRPCPRKADKSGVFFVGTSNYHKQNLDAHDKSQQNIACMAAKRVAENPSSDPLILMVRCMNREDYKHIERLNTTYHMVKNEQPFVSFELLTFDFLKKQNGVDMGSQYHMSM